MRERNYCGCCGRECDGEWCEPCQAHIDKRKTLWDATYYAQNGVDCPYQITSDEAIEEIGL